jgi:hypothetical protein
LGGLNTKIEFSMEDDIVDGLIFYGPVKILFTKR